MSEVEFVNYHTYMVISALKKEEVNKIIDNNLLMPLKGLAKSRIDKTYKVDYSKVDWGAVICRLKRKAGN